MALDITQRIRHLSLRIYNLSKLVLLLLSCLQNVIKIAEKISLKSISRIILVLIVILTNFPLTKYLALKA